MNYFTGRVCSFANGILSMFCDTEVFPHVQALTVMHEVVFF